MSLAYVALAVVFWLALVAWDAAWSAKRSSRDFGHRALASSEPGPLPDAQIPSSAATPRAPLFPDAS